MTAQHRRQRLALWVGLVTIVVWASAFTVQKQVYAAMSASGFLFARYLVVPLAAVLLLYRQHGLHWPRLTAPQWRAMLHHCTRRGETFSNFHEDHLSPCPHPGIQCQ